MAKKPSPPPSAPEDALVALLPAEDLLPDVQVRLDLLVRRFDLLERRVAFREAGLADLRPDLLPVVATGQAAMAEMERLEDLTVRVERLEKRGFAGRPGEVSLDFARFEPNHALSGQIVGLRARVEGLRRGDVVDIVVVEVVTGEPVHTVQLEITEDHPAGISADWRAPTVAKGQQGNYRFTARSRGLEARSPVLIVRGEG